MSVLPVGFGSSGSGGGGIDVGDIGHSLRFRRSASASITTSTNPATTSTYFCLFKQGALGAINPIFDGNIKINANNTITAFGLTTTAMARDPTSFHWMHVSNNGLVFDGVNLGAVTTSAITGLRLGYDGTNYADMYGARMCVVSGTSLPYTDFVTFNTTINEWVVKSKSAIKALVDAGDAESSMYEFDDATSLTTLGYDESSKANNATLNNFSLTAGTTYDHMLDVPGNSFCTASPIDLGANPGSSSLTEANLKSACSAVSGGSSTCGTQALPAGKWYWEYVPTAVGNGLLLGITSRTSGAPSGTAIGYVFTGEKSIAGSSSAYGATYAANDVIGIAVDTEANTVTFYKNNTSQGVITNATYLVPGCKPLHWNNSSSGSSTVQHNYGQAPLHASATYHTDAGGYFRYAPPTGFLALNQANLTTPAILNPEDHMDVVTVTKSGDTNFTIPWNATDYDTFFEIKRRDAAVDWYQIDGLRGYDKYLSSNSTAAETTDANVLGVSGTTGTLKSTLTDGTYVITMHKAGLTASRQTNTDGSITSTVSRNVDSGFAIVTYTGTGANATVGHGLGKVPSLVIVKKRSIGTAYSWTVQHKAVAAANVLFLDDTSAALSRPIAFNSTYPTTSVFSVGTDLGTNGNTDTFVAYCHADIEGYSKAFIYTGNNNADGPYVDVGFKAKRVLYKRSDAVSNWGDFDSIRDSSNVVQNYLLPNSPGAEGVFVTLDIDSSALKLQTSNADNNGGTIIGFAIADVAGKYSLAR